MFDSDIWRTEVLLVKRNDNNKNKIVILIKVKSCIFGFNGPFGLKEWEGKEKKRGGNNNCSARRENDKMILARENLIWTCTDKNIGPLGNGCNDYNFMDELLYMS